MNMNPTIIFIIGTIVIIGGIIGYRYVEESKPGQYDQVAQCIADSGAIFYGAFWCPHCQAQKDMFGNSAKLLPYVECSLPDGQTMTAECTEAGIKSFPTWVFSDGSRLDGTQTIEALAEKTSCEIEGNE